MPITDQVATAPCTDPIQEGGPMISSKVIQQRWRKI